MTNWHLFDLLDVVHCLSVKSNNDLLEAGKKSHSVNSGTLQLRCVPTEDERASSYVCEESEKERMTKKRKNLTLDDKLTDSFKR
jgi:hypothetical protein